MTVIKQDTGQLIQEQQAIEKKQKEDDERAKTINDFKNNKRMQKYIVKEIFDKILEDVYNLDNIPVSDDQIKVGNLTIQYKLARTGFKKVIDQLK